MGTPHSSLLTPVLTMRLLLLSSILVVSTLSYKLDPSPDRLSVSRLLSGSTNNKARSSMVQTMDCYDYNNQGGDRLHLTDYTPSLRKYNFDNRIGSCCFTGAPDDWNYDTINMYFNEYFIGDEEFTYNDTP